MDMATVSTIIGIAAIAVFLYFFRWVYSSWFNFYVFLAFTLIGYFDWLRVQSILLLLLLSNLSIGCVYFFLGTIWIQVKSVGPIAGFKSIFEEVSTNISALKNAWRKGASSRDVVGDGVTLPNPYWRYGSMVSLITVVLATACYLISVYSLLVSYLIAINWAAIIFAALDKSIADQGKGNNEQPDGTPTIDGQRIPEALLQAIGAIGGSGGLLIGIYLFRHKVVKGSFRIVTSVVVLAQFAVFLVILPGTGKLLELTGVIADFSPAQLVWKTSYATQISDLLRTRDKKDAPVSEDKIQDSQKKQKGVKLNPAPTQAPAPTTAPMAPAQPSSLPITPEPVNGNVPAAPRPAEATPQNVKKTQPVTKQATLEKQPVAPVASKPLSTTKPNSQPTSSDTSNSQADPPVAKSDKPSYESELDTCRKKGFFERGICSEQVKWKYCTVNGVWDNTKPGCERPSNF